ncbi:MAG: cation transporter [Atopobiaceae bacterium]|nr:cation transporter [Atopobiaceae bacterium]
MSTEESEGLLDAISKDADRDVQIVRTSIVGIVANVALAAFKAVFGLLSNSIAIVLDAVNNLSDALSSIITIVGTRIASRRADRKHPYGHGRAEYLTTIVIAVIVLWAGITSLVESVQRIIHPEPATYEVTTLVVVAVAVVAKLVLGRYVKGRGEALGSDSLVASGTDATMDAVISASTLVAAGINMAGGPGLEAPLGAVISLVIIKAGYEILREAIDKVIGERVDADVARAVKDAICSVDGVLGAYDLNLNDYGPQRLQGSVHVEVDEGASARDIDRMACEVQLRVLQRTGVLIHTVGVYSSNAGDHGEVADMRRFVEALVEEDEHVLEAHGLYVDDAAKTVRLDIVVSYAAEDRDAVYQQFVSRLEERFPDHRFLTVLDPDISD